MARSPQARHRRRRRFTPRRWLPFLALSALVVVAAVIEPQTPSLTTGQADPTLDLTRLPTVTAADAISTAWYCAGGSATGDGPAELSVVLANAASEGAVAEITAIGEAGAAKAAKTTEVRVPAHGRARVAASSLITADWAGLVVEVRGGRVAVDREVTGPLGFDAAPCATQAGDRWYVPSGVTVRGSHLYLSLFNPFADAASVDVSFATNTGRRTPKAFRSLTVDGRAVRVVDVGEVVTDRTSVAATVRARTGQVVVDRIQTHDGTGDPLPGGLEGDGGAPPKGLVSTTGVPVRADRWFFPSGRVSDGVRTQVAIYNPSARTAEIDLAVGYEDPKRNGTVEPLQISVPARDQEVVDLATIPGVLPDIDLWIDVRSIQGVPVVAERVSYYGAPSTRTGVGVSLGSPMASTRWLVTQAGPTRQRSATVQVANPGPATASVTVSDLSGGSASPLAGAAMELAPGDRRAIPLGEAGPAASLVIEADQPVVVASSLSLDSGVGLALEPGFAFSEDAVALPPFR